MASTIFVALLLIVSSSFSSGDSAVDQKCKNDLKGFLDCIKAEHDKVSDADRQAKKQEMQTKTTKCFTDNGCDAPKWDDKDPGAKAIKENMGSMPDAVKQCIKKKMIAKIGDKLNECLAKKHVESVNFTALADGMDSGAGAGMGLDMGAGAEGGKDGGISGALSAKFTTVKSVDGCCKDKNQGKPEAMKPLEQCLHGLKKDRKPQMCAMIKPCESKVSAECKKRGEDIKMALCQCKQEKEAEISKKLRDLGASKAKIGIQELMQVVASDIDMQDMMKQVDDCYTETNTPKNPLMVLAMKMMSGGGTGGGPGGRGGMAGMQLDGRTVVIMGDMMALDAEDKTECQPCP